ncbi:MAG: hypothetical protein MUD01_23095 [Chloroflexaceae bacterium]|jgi:hypothetical protein|nr:hypothetical protein [Chloroflexaceae bacterium]
MAIDSIRMLADSAGQLWHHLRRYGPGDRLLTSEHVEAWLQHCPTPPDPLAEQQLRREFRRLHTLVRELEVLLHSRSRALDMIVERAGELSREFTAESVKKRN